MEALLLARLEAVATAVTDLEADVAFAQRAEDMLARFHPATVRELRVALAVIDHPLSGLIWAGSAGRFRDQVADERARRIRAMSSSRFAMVRSMAAGARAAGAALIWSDPRRAGSVANWESS